MADAIIPPYPLSLTVKSWEKAKGLLAIITKVQTGVTEQLQAAKAQFDQMPWEKATSTGQLAEMKRRGSEALKEYMRNHHVTYQPKFRMLQSVYADLSSNLADKAKEFEVDPKLAKFAPILKKMAEDANKFTYAVAWGSVSDRLQKEFLLAEKELAERAQKSRERIDLIVPAIEKVVKKLGDFDKKPPTTKEYASLFAQYHRLPGTYITVVAKDLPEVAEVFKPFLTYASKSWTKEPGPKTDMAKMVEDDLEQLAKAKKLAEKL